MRDATLASAPTALLVTRTLVVAVVLYFVARALRDRRRRDSRDVATRARAAVDRATAYSSEDVAKHASKDDLWVIIDGKVYDLTEYADEHPGGADALARNAGGDATTGFRGPQHPSRVFDVVDDYLIGVLA